MAEAAIGLAGLVLAIPGIVDLCIQYGEFIRAKYQDGRDAEAQQEHEKLRITDRLATLKMQSSVLEMIEGPELLYFEFQIREIHDNATSLRDLLKAKTANWLKWASVEKARVRKLLAAVENAQQLFTNKAVLYIARSIANAAQRASATDAAIIARFVEESSRKRQSQDDSMSGVDISLIEGATGLPCSEVSIVEKRSGGLCIVETRDYSNNLEREDAKSRIRDVAHALHEVGDENKDFLLRTGIPQCKGYHERDRVLHLVFDLPSGVGTVDSLREILLDAEPRHPLNDRVELACSIAKAVFYTHAYKYVHKNIRPSNIILMDPRPCDLAANKPNKPKKSRVLGQALLVGWSDARLNDSSSRRLGGAQRARMEMELYQHPSRTTGGKVSKYTFLHDVYSLGVCLLEIGLWTNFLDEDDWPKLPQLTQAERCATFVELARSALPRVLGWAYADVVQKCLTCTDGGFGKVDDAVDDNGRRVGVRYVDHVLAGLQSISL